MDLCLNIGVRMASTEASTEEKRKFSFKIRKITFKEEFSREALFCFMAFLSVYIYLSLISFSPLDPSPFSKSIPEFKNGNWGGALGSQISGILIYCCGVCSLLLPLPLPHMAFSYLRKEPFPFGRVRTFGWFLVIISLSATASKFIEPVSFDKFYLASGGWIGDIIHNNLNWYLGTWGELALLTSMAVSGLILLLRRPLIKPTAQGISGIGKKIRKPEFKKAKAEIDLPEEAPEEITPQAKNPIDIPIKELPKVTEAKT